jgi:predicted regulator of Ras-like GTPase activity (Roadblock/LC7/MglB family)
MWKKIFGSNDNSEGIDPPDRAQLQRLMAEIALDTPRAEWVALVKYDGIFIGSFPAKPGVETDCISAMSAAMSSLGTRIAGELKNGDMQYTLIAGTNGITVMIELSTKYLLAIGLKKDVSIEEFLKRMQNTGLPLLTKALHIEAVPQLSGISQGND